MKYTPAQVKKAIVAGVVFLAQVLAVILATPNADIIPASWLPYITAFLAVVGTLGVFQTRNATHVPEKTHAAYDDIKGWRDVA